jgi:hypothetical protein
MNIQYGNDCSRVFQDGTAVDMTATGSNAPRLLITEIRSVVRRQ